MRTRLIFLLVCFGAAFLGAGGAAAAQGLSTQSSSAAGVTVKVTPRALSGSAWEFEIVFDTHTQELNDDLLKTASLRADGKPLAAAGWQGDPPGGHHRKGVLKFSAVDPRAQEIELRITRPGEPKPRSFRWQLLK
jgi:hypothetical protein